MAAGETGRDGADTVSENADEASAGAGRASDAQLRYLRCGLDQPGGKLPLFDDDGRQFPARTIRACIDRGWAEPWFDNPTRPDWLVCKLTDAGRAAAAAEN